MKKARFISLILGILIATVIVLSQILYVPTTKVADVNPETEQQNPLPEGESLLVLSSYSLPSTSTSLLVSHDLSFIHEILFASQKPDATPFIPQLSVGKLFKALFQFIISPNAP
ncbi:MAG: hypothetical protein KF725_14895 [Cyclobacteriaceae bacterium]|nr:hypothetical protein [Cyclobacteriaceae bacterium]UYN87362.1 MAG: hypothetical protein KIT51_03560 [Cyclobacteriaceae bacterium]